MSDTAAKQLRRVLRVIPEIGDGGQHDVNAVASLVGVDRHTLINDLKTLADRYGAPGGFVEGMQIYIDDKSVGIVSDHFLRPMGLTVSELKALELGLAVLRSESPPDETALIDKTRDRLRKVVAKLPRDFNETDLRHAEAAPTEGLAYLDELRVALRDRRKATITYRRGSSEQPTVRTVRIYAIVPASGMWYAIAYCETSQGLRVFRLDRVESATAVTDRYEIPSDFSVSKVLEKGKGLKAEASSSGITVRYSPRIARWIAEREGMAVSDDGSLTVEHPLADEDWGMRHVLQYGPDAELLEPLDIRRKIIERLRVLSDNQNPDM